MGSKTKHALKNIPALNTHISFIHRKGRRALIPCLRDKGAHLKQFTETKLHRNPLDIRVLDFIKAWESNVKNRKKKKTSITDLSIN